MLKEHIKIREPENFQPYNSKVAIATAAEGRKKQLLPSSHAYMVFHTNSCNFEIFKTFIP